MQNALLIWGYVSLQSFILDKHIQVYQRLRHISNRISHNLRIGPAFLAGVMFWGVTVCNSTYASVAPNNTLLILGDSLSAGYGVSQAKTWVSLLQKRLQELHPDVDVVNASISGETSMGGRNRLHRLLQQHRARWLLLELGANDGLQGLPVKLMRENLQAMIEMAQKNGTRVILVGMKLPPNYGQTYTTAFANTFPSLAKHYQTELVPFFLEGIASNLDMMQADGIHPNLLAQPYLLENIWPVLERALVDKK